MLRPRRRLTKREIKEDKFVTYTLIAFNFVRNNIRYFLGGIIAIVVIAIAISIFYSMSRSKEAKASELMMEAQTSLSNGDKEEAIDTYNKLIESYSRTGAYVEAALRLGNIYFNDGLYEKAIDIFRKLADRAGGDDVIAYSAESGIAASLENLGRYKEAGERYMRFVRKYPKSAFAPQALFEASRCFRLAGDYSSARHNLEKLSKEYPESLIAYKAEAELRMLPPAHP